MKQDRVELLFLHSPCPEACGALPGVIRENITASVAYSIVTRPICSFFQSDCSRLYVLAHAYSTVTNASLQYRRAGVMLLQRPGTRVSPKALRAQASVLQMV